MIGIKKNYVFVAGLILVLGCAKENSSKKIIDNKSASDLKVTLFGSPPERRLRETFTVGAKTARSIVEFNSSEGTIYAEGSCARNDIDSIAVEVVGNASLKVNKDITDDDNWQFSTKSKSKGVETECKLTISDSDVIPL